jgi:hypothetical protein
MPAITGSSLGYAGEINEVTGKDFWNRIGASKYGVVGANDLKVSTTTGDRMLLVAAGVAWGHNIQDTLDTSVSIQLNSVSSGSRWDLIVVRRDATAGSSIEYVTGTSSKVLPSLTTGNTSHADQPLALCRVDAGSTTVQEAIDLRCWAANGGLYAADLLARDYLNVPGARVRIGGELHEYVPNSQGTFVWEKRETMFREWNGVTTITVPYSAGASRAISFPAGMFDVPPIVLTSRVGAGSAKMIAYHTNVTTSGCTIGVYSGDGSPYDTTVSVNFRAVQTSPGRAAGVNP